MIEINKKLLSACMDHYNGFSQINELFAAGEGPLGEVIIDSSGRKDNLYTAVVNYYLWDDDYFRLLEITKLFCDYGMVLSKPAIPYDNGDILNPVWYFTILTKYNVLPILKYLLDRGLDADSAFQCWYHAVEYWTFSSDDIFDEEQVYSDISKIMLIASYSHILRNDEALQEVVCLDQNDYDIAKLRDWNKYEIICSEFHIRGASIIVRDKESGQEIWRLSNFLELF